jgi:hypothetical protein
VRPLRGCPLGVQARGRSAVRADARVVGPRRRGLPRRARPGQATDVDPAGMDHRRDGMAARPRRASPVWAVRASLLLVLAAIALLGVVGWFQDSESAGGDSGWHSHADYVGAEIGIAHVVLGLAAIGAACSRRPFGIVIGVVAIGVGVVTLACWAGAGLASVAGNGDEQSSSLLGVTGLALVAVGSIAAIVDVIRLGCRVAGRLRRARAGVPGAVVIRRSRR